MRSILYATDLTEQSIPALRYAYDLSISLGTDLVVFHSHEIPPIRLSVKRPIKQLEYHLIAEQKEIVKSYCIKHLGEEIDLDKLRIVVVCGDSVLDGIIGLSKELSPDLVLIGRKGKHTERGMFAGDIGQGLLKRLSCPIMIVPGNIEAAPIRTILYATDFEEADIAAVESLAPIAKQVNAKIHFIHVTTEEQYAKSNQMEWFKEMLAKRIDYKNLEFKVVFSEKIEEKLKEYSERINADMIALLYREEKGFFQNLFNKSLVIKLDDQIGIPLMSFSK
ncbi:universal stress protein [Flavobacteriaceae bacterium F89]|jgi:nucleotide-binding universal stress UspA family protein|uniref:Universal stress protein n=1 Tax=Cerina litoralis TaxID=2874477 RepID=A0AAE3EXY9_9FLAO|nr:universal stress protein [Cerina litoralis]MCG2461767.1 universal stress protein [Cerina litoralis]